MAGYTINTFCLGVSFSCLSFLAVRGGGWGRGGGYICGYINYWEEVTNWEKWASSISGLGLGLGLGLVVCILQHQYSCVFWGGSFDCRGAFSARRGESPIFTAPLLAPCAMRFVVFCSVSTGPVCATGCSPKNNEVMGKSEATDCDGLFSGIYVGEGTSLSDGP